MKNQLSEMRAFRTRTCSRPEVLLYDHHQLLFKSTGGSRKVVILQLKLRVSHWI